MAEAQAFLDQFMHQRNSAALEDFRGLSAEQRGKLLYKPTDSRQLLEWRAPPAECNAAT